MIERTLAKEMLELITQVPVITLLGPRQSGKTTLVRSLFPEYNYVNLEDPKTRELAITDYEGFFARYKEPLIIDEVQRVPDILSAIQVRVDADREKNGRFILTGSHQPLLQQGVAQSLAGRTSLMTLMPLSMEEIQHDSGAYDISDIDSLLLRGFMPELYRANSRKPHIYYRDYLETYVERDLRGLLEVKNLDTFFRFLTLLAGRTGQIVNLSAMSGEVGVSSTTLREWLSVLEASFVVFLLKPYYSNLSKQQVKSPKVYFSEVGLASYLIGLESAAQVSRDPLRGQLFENLVVSEALKARLNAGEEPNLFFVRTAKGVEVDMVLKKEGHLYPFEIKSSMTPNSDFLRHLASFCRAEETAAEPAVIYAGEEYPSFYGARYIHYSHTAERM
ncbi:MAG: ATP-binding protein [Lachnospiraceae bacterium]|jgi:predicted AAA+ superfamily ATPase|nr:ATP-binding protein [Lachnospiraceae bacterium]MEE3461218.1 ATP-binding protein [Lachnospiraceae bacterium]